MKILEIYGKAINVVDEIEKFSKVFMRKLPCLYIIWKDNKVIYVGSSEDCVERLKKHFKYKNPNSSIFIKHYLRYYGSLQGIEDCFVIVQVFDNVLEVREGEVNAIKVLKPLFNVKYK